MGTGRCGMDGQNDSSAADMRASHFCAYTLRSSLTRCDKGHGRLYQGILGLFLVLARLLLRVHRSDLSAGCGFAASTIGQMRDRVIRPAAATSTEGLCAGERAVLQSHAVGADRTAIVGIVLVLPTAHAATGKGGRACVVVTAHHTHRPVICRCRVKCRVSLTRQIEAPCLLW